MIVYNFGPEDYQAIIWELTCRVKDLEDKVDYLEAVIYGIESDRELDGMAE